jgi:hypothetical protein
LLFSDCPEPHLKKGTPYREAFFVITVFGAKRPAATQGSNKEKKKSKKNNRQNIGRMRGFAYLQRSKKETKQTNERGYNKTKVKGRGGGEIK